MTKSQLREFEVLPSGEMQQKYDLYAETCPKITLDPNNVPEELRHIIPLAEKYGVGCDIRRHDLGSKTSEHDKQALSKALKGSHRHIAKWLNMLRETPISVANPPSEESVAFIRLCVFETEECDGPGLPGEGTDVDKWYDEYLIRRYGTID